MHEFVALASGLCRECGAPPRAHDLDDGPPARARSTDPETSHDAAATVNVTEQARRILVAYADGDELLDTEAYDRAGFPTTGARSQRCSDLLAAHLIEATGTRERSSGRRGRTCRITPTGRAVLAAAGDEMLIEALREELAVSQCSKCDEEIEWAETMKGKRIPLDLGRPPNANLVVDHQRASESGMIDVVRYVKPGDGTRVSHFATCEYAAEFRR